MAASESREISPSSSPANANNAPKFGTLILNRVFVGGIAGSTTEVELHDLFSKYATVKATKIILDRAGVSKGYGFVTFSCESEAKRVLEEPEIMLKDRKLNVAQAIKKQVEATSAISGPVIYPSSMPCTYQNGMAFFPQTVDPNYNGIVNQHGQTFQMVYPQYYVPQQQQPQQQQQYTQPTTNLSTQALVGSQYSRWQYPQTNSVSTAMVATSDMMQLPPQYLHCATLPQYLNYNQYPQQQAYLSYSGSVIAAPNQPQQSNTSSGNTQPSSNNSATTAPAMHQNILPRIHVNQQSVVNGAHNDISSSMINHLPNDYLTINAAQQPPCTNHLYYQAVTPFSYLPNGIPPDPSHFEQAGQDTLQCTPNRKKKDYLSPMFQNSSRTPSPNRPLKGYKDGITYNKSIHHLVPKAVNGVTVLTCPKADDKENIINRSSPLTPPPTPRESSCHPPPQVSYDANHKLRHLSL
ncbi:Protein boule [Nymphon striatum]|nr:Protein boule [Nymphon striatum]